MQKLDALFASDPDRTLALELDADFDAWWDHWFSHARRREPADGHLVTDARGFIGLVRRRAADRFGAGLRADHIGYLLSLAAMLAKDLQDLDRVLDEIAVWYDRHSPRTLRDGIVEARRAAYAAMPDASDVSSLETVVRRMHAADSMGHQVIHVGGIRPTASVPPAGPRTTRTGTPHDTLSAATPAKAARRHRLLLAIGAEGQMALGVMHGLSAVMISQIDDRDGGGRGRAPTPVPELVA